MKYRVGIDLGGTNIAAGIVDESGKIIKKMSVPTPSGESYCVVVKEMAELSKKHIEEASLVEYLSSFRSEYHFHEECVEMIYKRLSDDYWYCP